MSIANAREAGAPISGTMLIKADGATVVEEAFTDLAPNRKAKASGTWTAEQAADVIWEFSVELDSEQDPVEPKTATTVVTVKPGNKNTGPKK